MSELATPTLASTSTQYVRFPNVSRPLPGPDTLEHVLACPIAQLIVAGRSGSVLIHAYLDGHPEVLHIPHTFKFFDFVAATPDLLTLDSATMCRRFVDSPLTQFLFDSSKSVIIGGRLGPEMNVYVEIDRQRFCEAFVSLTRGATVTHRSVFCALVAAFGWCAGQDPKRARVLLHHLHHGDWLFPGVLIDRSNWPDAASVDGLTLLRPSRIIQAIRDPYDTFQSTVVFSRKHQLPEAGVVTTQEMYGRLLAQDWFRWRLIQRVAGWGFGVRLEDIRKNPREGMRRCAEELGIDPNAPALDAPTFYGFTWMGDIYTTPTPTARASPDRGDVAWQDRAYLDALLGGWIAAEGYTRSNGTASAGALMKLSVLAPSPTLRSVGANALERWRAAASTTMDRFQFVRRFSEAKLAAGLTA